MPFRRCLRKGCCPVGIIPPRRPKLRAGEQLFCVFFVEIFSMQNEPAPNRRSWFVSCFVVSAARSCAK